MRQPYKQDYVVMDTAQNHFPSSSYPMLDGLGDAQPYPTNERDFNEQLSQFEQHQVMTHDHLQQDTTPYPDGVDDMTHDDFDAPLQTSDEVQQQDLDVPHIPDQKVNGEDVDSPERSAAIPRPIRKITKDANGRYCCNWPGCTEDIRDFNRRCEWSKHMDKHDRPYKCPAEGCEKLPGFTYSGGLLRHEREVHNKHGGPRKQLNCPHQNCKRHKGKGFSRQENLNEHLRRVHTGTDVDIAREEAEEVVEAQTGQKRKHVNGDEDLMEEIQRLKAENEDLKRQVQEQNAHSNEMARQIFQLQQNQQNQLSQILAASAARSGGARMAPAQML